MTTILTEAILAITILAITTHHNVLITTIAQTTTKTRMTNQQIKKEIMIRTIEEEIVAIKATPIQVSTTLPPRLKAEVRDGEQQ